MPRPLLDLAAECRRIYDNAANALGPDLGGGSLLDLCADNVADASLADLKAAIVVSGIHASANDRIKQQIAQYR